MVVIVYDVSWFECPLAQNTSFQALTSLVRLCFIMQGWALSVREVDTDSVTMLATKFTILIKKLKQKKL